MLELCIQTRDNRSIISDTDPNQNPPVRSTISNLEANISIVGICASLKAIYFTGWDFYPLPTSLCGLINH